MTEEETSVSETKQAPRQTPQSKESDVAVGLSLSEELHAQRDGLSVEMQEAAANSMFEYLKNVLYNPHSAQLDVEELPAAFQDLGTGLLYVGNCLAESRELANDIAKGRLNTNPLSQGNELASGLKNLQATLKHLTWQLGQVAKGDYKQQVSFVGDFSEAINNMIFQLDERDTALQTEITLNQEKNEELLQSVSLFEVITANIADWIIVIDRESKELLYTNHPPEMVLYSMSSFEELKKWVDYQIERARKEEEQQLKEEQKRENEQRGDRNKTLRKKAPQVLEFSNDEDDEIQFFTVARFPMSWYDHKAFVFKLTNITEEKQMLDALQVAAYHDALTGAYSRHYGMRLFENLLNQNEAFVVVFVDMDNLKYVNDTFGHNEGDAYIIDVTNHLKHFDDDAIISRLGGDEFMVLCKGWSKEAADKKLEIIRQNLIDNSGESYLRSISYGVIEVVENNDKTGSLLLSIADEIMYDYKRARKMERRAGE